MKTMVVDPTDPGHDVEVLREHVRHLERRIRELHAERAAGVMACEHSWTLHSAGWGNDKSLSLFVCVKCPATKYEPTAGVGACPGCNCGSTVPSPEWHHLTCPYRNAGVGGTPAPSPTILDVGFKYENRVHTPTVLLGFRDWDARDAFVKALTGGVKEPLKDKP